MADPFKALKRFSRGVFDRIEQTLDRVSDDPLVQRALESDLGLPPGALDKAKVKRPELSGIDEYINASDPSAEKLKLSLDAIKAYVKFWTTVFQAAKTEDPSVIVDEALYRLLQTATVDLIRFDYPTFYAVMRLIRVIEQDIRLTAEETLAPEAPANIFTDDWLEGWQAAFERNYMRFRLEQDGDIVDRPAATNTEQQQLSFDIFWRSDLALLLPSLVLVILKERFERATFGTLDVFYGWELPPGEPRGPCEPPGPATGASISEHIASRGSTVRVSVPSAHPESASATLTQFLFKDAEDRRGLLVSLRGRVAFAGAAGAKERPLRVSGTIDAKDGLDLFVRSTGITLAGAPSGGLQLALEPAETSVRGPPFFIPGPSGSRIEIGDFSFKIDVSPDGLKVRAAARKSAFVLEPGDADSFVGNALKSKATRVDFDIGLTVDNENGLYLDGGGRLSTTIPINGSILRSVQLSLGRESSAAGSEARLEAVASMRFNLGGFLVTSVEQIGITFGIGSSRDAAPEGALELLGPVLYLCDVGFRHPSGVGILVDAWGVTGGGFLFYDADNEQYAGVVQLELCERVSLTAIGLVTTKMPDGSRDFSMMLIASIEFDPPLGPFLWISLAGVGVLVGINRMLDADALRAGLRNRMLDDILFPPDPVANAARVVNSVRSVFPPAVNRHVIGISLKLGLAKPTWLTAELALVFERDGCETRRVALMGQLHAGLPRGPKQIFVMHLDGVGIWDLERDEFSLDLHLYDSRLAFATLAGDVAIRKRDRGEDKYVLISAGGYHPEFPVPATFPKLERLRISLVDTDHVRLSLTGYLAFTPNTKQFGAKVELFIGGSNFSFEATLSFDALFTEDVGFIVDFDLEIKFKFRGNTLCGVDVYGRLTGSEPKHVAGEWSIDLWLTSIGGSFDRTFGSERPPASLPPIDPLPPLVEALENPGSWAANLPRRNRTLVSLRKRPGGGQVLLHPLGALEVRQTVLPLGVTIDRFGGSPLSSSRRFDITDVALGGQPVTAPRAVDDFFAAGDFLELSDDEKLARPSFEGMQAGVAVQAGGLAAGEAIASEMDFDDVIFGAGGPIVRHPTKGTVTGPAAAFAATFGAAGRSPLRVTGLGRFDAPPLGVKLSRTGYVVARVDDLTPADATPAASFTSARQALDKRRAADPRAARELQVVAAFHTEAPA